ncbi:MAG: diguanylate cyclase [Verrucomicrobiota bacterium]
MKALIIEPSSLFQQVLQACFEETNIRTVACTNGKSALNTLKKAHFDLICSAYCLDDMDGAELCKELRENRVEQTPLILLTSEDNTARLQASLARDTAEIFGKSDLGRLKTYLEAVAGKTEALYWQSGQVLLFRKSNDTKGLSEMFHLLGLEVEHVLDTGCAQELLELNPEKYNLLMIDLGFGEKANGLTLMRNLRQHRNAHLFRLPILTIASLDDMGSAIEALREGANDYLPQPFYEREVILRVRNLIENKNLLDKVHAQQKRLEELSIVDPLTQLYNRHHLIYTLPSILNEAQRHKIPVSLFVMDLDHFKAINDTHGHVTGDMALISAAQLLKDHIRDCDIAARFGGEEFVAVLKHCEGDDALEKVEKIRLLLEALRPEDILVTASFGVTCLTPGESATFNELFEVADQALYQAKESGRNQVRYLPFSRK